MKISPLNLPPKRIEVRRPVFVIGIGSPHGDDRAGWEVIERLARIVSNEFFLRKASVPHDVLDWLDVHSPTYIIDASYDRVPGVRRFTITQDDMGKLRLSSHSSTGLTNTECSFDSLSSNSTHQLGLSSTLELAAALGRLPRQLYLWTVSIEAVEKNGEVKTETQILIDECTVTMAKELLEFTSGRN